MSPFPQPDGQLEFKKYADSNMVLKNVPLHKLSVNILINKLSFFF